MMVLFGMFLAQHVMLFILSRIVLLTPILKGHAVVTVEFPNHVQARMREPCGKSLMKAVKTSKGSQYLAPFRTYCYRSLVDSLQNLLNRPNIMEACEQWRSRSVNSDEFGDVFSI